jgi:hypothetical protein
MRDTSSTHPHNSGPHSPASQQLPSGLWPGRGWPCPCQRWPEQLLSPPPPSVLEPGAQKGAYSQQQSHTCSQAVHADITGALPTPILNVLNILHNDVLLLSLQTKAASCSTSGVLCEAAGGLAVDDQAMPHTPSGLKQVRLTSIFHSVPPAFSSLPRPPSML